MPRSFEYKFATRAICPFGLTATLSGPAPPDVTEPVYVKTSDERVRPLITAFVVESNIKEFTRTLLGGAIVMPDALSGRLRLPVLIFALTSIDVTSLRPAALVTKTSLPSGVNARPIGAKMVKDPVRTGSGDLT